MFILLKESDDLRTFFDMFFCAKCLLVLTALVLAFKVGAKPANDFVFRDEDEAEHDPPLLRLEDEKQILPSDRSKLLGGESEIIEPHLENGKFFQGDIVLVQDQKEYLLANDTKDGSVPTRTGWIDEYYRWPKDKNGDVILPYYVSPESQYSKKLKKQV